LIILIILGKKNKLWSSSLCSFLQPPVTSSLYGPNILLNILFLNTLSVFSSLISETNFHTHKLTDIIIVLSILILTVLDSRRGDERSVCMYVW
jgi:hypothetical protein